MAALTVGEELLRALLEKGPGGNPFPKVWLRDETRRALAASLMAGRHLLLLGPPGCGKTRLAQSLSALLPPLAVVKDCPVNCRWEEPGCPWCAASTGKEKEERPGEKRQVQAVGSNALQWEELLGETDPVLGMRFGTGDLRSFVPGRLLRANHGLLLLDHIESIPPRTLNSLLHRLKERGVQLGAGTQELEVPLDLLVVGIGSPRALATLSANLLDHFDVIRLVPPEGLGEKKEVLEWGTPQDENGCQREVGLFMAKTLELAEKIDRHPEVEQGVSSRGTMRCLELLGTLPQVNRRLAPAFEDFREAALISFPHRLRLKGSALSRIDPVALVDQLIREEEEKGEGGPEGPPKNVKYLLIARELAQSYSLSHPLRWGHHGLLLRRIKNHPQSQLAQFYQEMVEELRERRAQGEPLRGQRERFLHEMELLEEIEAANPERELEENALEETLERLGRAQVIQREGEGWTFHREAVRQLLNELLPQEAHRWQSLSAFDGRHLRESPALLLPRERLPEIRRYQRGDHYRDLALRATLREAVRRRRDLPLRGMGPVPVDEPGCKADGAREGLEPADLRVYQRGKAFRLDIMLALDLSGTMRQGEKLWYAKEAVGALAYASSLCRDRVGLVTFSNLATLVLGPVADPVRVMEKAIDLWIRRNAFTNLGHALKLSREACLRSRLAITVPHIILISDGQATAPFSDPKGFALREAAAAQRSRVTISCVCLLEGSSDVELMRRISQIGRGRLFLVEDIRSLPEIIRQEQAALKRS